MPRRFDDPLTTRSRPAAEPVDAPSEHVVFDPAADTARNWLAKSARGDRGAFGRFVVLYQDRLFNTLLRLVGDFEEAGELTQEAFTRALATLSQYRPEVEPYLWLFRIGSNLAITRLKQVQRRRAFSLDRFDPAEEQAVIAARDQAASLRRGSRASAASQVQKRERDRGRQVFLALGRLDAAQRLILVMRDLEAFDYPQIADLLQLPVAALQSKLFRARIALRDQLNQSVESSS